MIELHSYREDSETLREGQMNVLRFIRSAGEKGVPWTAVWQKCCDEGVSAEDFDSLSLLGLIRQNGQMIFKAAEFI